MEAVSLRPCSSRNTKGEGFVCLCCRAVRCPKLNGCVERAQRTHTEEFYKVREFSLPFALVNRELRKWEQIYNTVRPYQALGYLTPDEFVLKWQSEKRRDS